MALNYYDIVVIVDPKLTESNLKDLISKVKKIISSAGGEILTEDNWGIKKISHPIKKNKDGLYYFMKTKIDGSKVKDIRSNIKLTDGVLRVSIIKSLVEIIK